MTISSSPERPGVDPRSDVETENAASQADCSVFGIAVPSATGLSWREFFIRLGEGTLPKPDKPKADS
jgi:hypothetical protein